MTKRIQSQPTAAPAAAPVFPAKARQSEHPASGASTHARKRRGSAESGLLRLCEEVAGRLLRRSLELRDPVRAVRETRGELVSLLACDQLRAGHIVDLALELLHVKAHGNFKRNALELSQLIARAGNQLRNPADN